MGLNMKDLLAKLIRMFHQPEATKPVEPWPFPKDCKGSCGDCKGSEKKPAKKTVAKKKPAAKKTAVKKAKK